MCAIGHDRLRNSVVILGRILRVAWLVCRRDKASSAFVVAFANRGDQHHRSRLGRAFWFGAMKPHLELAWSVKYPRRYGQGKGVQPDTLAPRAGTARNTAGLRSNEVLGSRDSNPYDSLRARARILVGATRQHGLRRGGPACRYSVLSLTV